MRNKLSDERVLEVTRVAAPFLRFYAQRDRALSELTVRRALREAGPVLRSLCLPVPNHARTMQRVGEAFVEACC